MVKVGELSVAVVAQHSQFTKGMQESRRASAQFAKAARQNIGGSATEVSQSMNRAGNSASGFGQRLKNIPNAKGMLQGIARGAAGVATAFAAAATAVGAMSIKIAADSEMTQVALETLLGDASKAKKLGEDINDFAASTPLQEDVLKNSAKQLLVFNTSAKDVVPTLKQLGSITALMGGDLEELSKLYGRARQNQVLFTEDLNQFSDRGVPIFEVLARKFNTTTVEIRKMASQGKLSFKDLQFVLDQVTGAGGRFEGALVKASRTVSGRVSTLRDNVTAVMRDIGTSLIEGLDVHDGITGLTDSLKEFREEMKPVVKTLVQDVRKAFADSGITVRDLAEGVKMLAGAFTVLVRESLRALKVMKDIAKFQMASKNGALGIGSTFGSEVAGAVGAGKVGRKISTALGTNEVPIKDESIRKLGDEMRAVMQNLQLGAIGRNPNSSLVMSSGAEE